MNAGERHVISQAEEVVKEYARELLGQTVNLMQDYNNGLVHVDPFMIANNMNDLVDWLMPDSSIEYAVGEDYQVVALPKDE